MSVRRGACLTAVMTVVVGTSLTGAGAGATRDHAAQAWNVLPPGQAGGVAFTKNSTDQIALYEGLTRLGGNVTDADLRRFFKRETLGLAPGERARSVERPRKGLTITRDRWGVPHVKGVTAEDVAFGAGWATAADRQLLMELFRGPGRIAALDAPGVDPFAFALSGTHVPAERPDGSGARAASSTSSVREGRRGDARSGSSTRTSPGSTRSTAGQVSRCRAGRERTSSPSAA